MMAGFLAVTLAIVLAPGSASEKRRSPHIPATFALLPLVAGDTGLPYAVLPTLQERHALGRRIQRRMMAPKRLLAVNDTRVQEAVARAGFDQDSALRACNSADCARKIGRRLGVKTVVFGSVTRYLALIWGAEVTMVDVASGSTRGPYSIGYKGDYISLSMGIAPLADSLEATLSGRPGPRLKPEDQ